MTLEVRQILQLITAFNHIAHQAPTPKARRIFFAAKAELINTIATMGVQLEVIVVRPGLLFVRVENSERGWHIPIPMAAEELLQRLHA